MVGAQIRAARALIGWTAQELANHSGVGVATIRRAELKPGESGLTSPIAAAITRALEAAGIEFIAENGGGVGVRMRKPAGAA